MQQIKKNFRTLETLGKPVVSCLNGTALGGGWELALVGHHRVAVDDPKIQFGLPEVTLGLLPGASGVTKMTRQLGLMGAQPYLVEGKTFGPREAQQMGLVHELVADASQLRPKALAWIAANPTPQRTSVGREGLQDAGRHAEQPEDRAWAGGGPGDAEEADARPLPGARSDPRLHGRGRDGGFRHGAAHRAPLPRQARVEHQRRRR